MVEIVLKKNGADLIKPFLEILKIKKGLIRNIKGLLYVSNIPK